MRQGTALPAAAVLWMAMAAGACTRQPSPSAAADGAMAVKAPPPPASEWEAARAAADQELGAQVNRLRKGGPARADVRKSFTEAVGRWRAAVPGATEVRFTDEQCFGGGCMVTLAFPKTVAHEVIDSALLRDEAFMKWPGGKFRSGVFSADDKTSKVVWTFFVDAPADGGAR